MLRKSATGLDRDLVANVSLLVAIDKAVLTERVGRVPERKLELVLAGSRWCWDGDNLVHAVTCHHKSFSKLSP